MVTPRPTNLVFSLMPSVPSFSSCGTCSCFSWPMPHHLPRFGFRVCATASRNSSRCPKLLATIQRQPIQATDVSGVPGTFAPNLVRRKFQHPANHRVQKLGSCRIVKKCRSPGRVTSRSLQTAAIFRRAGAAGSNAARHAVRWRFPTCGCAALFIAALFVSCESSVAWSVKVG